LALILSLALLVAPVAAKAEQPSKIPRVGVLRIGAPIDPSTDAFRQGLRDLGYAEGQNVLIEDRWAKGRLERLPELAADLVRLPVDVIVSGGVVGTRAAKGATTTIPIVMQSTDPLGAGLIASLARPGGNITGVATLESELGAKRLEFFREAFPTIARVTVLYDSTTSPSVLKEVEAAAPGLKMSLHVLQIKAREDLNKAFKEATQWRAAALSVLASPFFQSERVLISRLSLEHRLPSMVPHRTYAEAGGLMSYGPDFRDLSRRTAIFVDKILKGAKPGDLPIEQPTKFELVVNLKTAKALGLTIPQSLLLRADQIIE
jgi:putative tryptophan/tyrosine transport system substrate-binding protein